MIAASSLLSASSAGLNSASKVRIALYVDDGSRGNGVLQWASFVAFSPQTEFSTITGEEVRNGKLDKVDILIMPGGASWWQCPSLGEKGMNAVRDFVRRGGGYVGTCAGMACAMNDKERIGLLPYNSNKQLRGGVGIVSVEISPEGAGILGIAPGLRAFRYAGGPIVYACEKPIEESSATVLATFKSEVTGKGRAAGGFDYPAMLLGKYGKGKVVVSSIHPESWEATDYITSAMIYAACGVKIAPEMPVKNPRPWRVGFVSVAIIGHESVNAVLELMRDPDLDVRVVMKQDIVEGALSHLDYLVIPDGVEFLYKKYLATDIYRNGLKRFMDRGGIVLASGCTVKYIDKHKNLQCFDTVSNSIKQLLKK